MKKSEFISFRCSEKIKNLIEADSIEKEWTISHTVEKILTEYYERNKGRSKANCTKYTFLFFYFFNNILKAKTQTLLLQKPRTRWELEICPVCALAASFKLPAFFSQSKEIYILQISPRAGRERKRKRASHT